MVDLEWRDRVALICLNRPEARNALNFELLGSLGRRLDDVSEARAVVLCGVGGTFCAGADLRERLELSPAERTGHTRMIAALCDRLDRLEVPVVAAVQGYCLAGGCELGLACDVRIAAPDAQFGFPEVGLGIFPGADGPLRLTRLVGPGAAARMLYSGRRLGAEEALRLGLVEEVGADALAAALAWASEVAQASPVAVRALKSALLASRDLPFQQGQMVVRLLREPLDAGADYTAALLAFREKHS